MSRALAWIAVTFIALTPALAHAVVVSGQVVDENGFGIFNVDLDFFDRNLGQIIFTPFDNTDAGGFYSIDVPVSEYDITFDANNPVFLGQEFRQVSVTGPLTLDTTLLFAQLATGHVQDAVGAPLVAVDLDFVNVATGLQFLANDDNTDLFGNFSVLVPGLTFDVFFTPPLGMPKAGAVQRSVAVAGTTSLGVTTLPDGFAVTGRVLSPLAVPQDAIDTDYHDATTGERIFTPRDNTDSVGVFDPFVAIGTYDVTVAPPAITGWAWQTVHDVAVPGPGPTALGDITLQPGFAVTGLVVNESFTPVPIADLDMVSIATGHDLPTADDNTNATGVFNLLPPASTFDLIVKPPAGTAMAATVVRNVVVGAPVNVGMIVLATGFEISGTVRDVFGNPVNDADFDTAELASGLPFPTVNDHTGVDGTYAFRLPGWSWTITITPPVGSGLVSRSFVLNPLSAPTSMDFILGSQTVAVNEAAPRDGTRFLLPNTPNPFRASTRIAFDVPRGIADATLTIVDTAGRRVRGYQFDGASGRMSLEWDGRDGSGQRVASGVYFYRLQSAQVDVTRKMTFIR